MPIQITAQYKKAFKEADIRGIYPQEIDEELTYLIARAFVEEFSCSQVIVGRDMRLSSPTLHEAFCKGVVDAGADVLDIGLVSTPMVYYASGSMNLPGVVITASHSPKKYNGLKLVLPGAIPLTEKHGLGAIRRRIEKGKYTEVSKPGKVREKDIKKAYQQFVCKGIRRQDYAALSVVADCGNGMAGVVLPLLKEKLPIDFVTLFPELDGNFPNRDSDPTLRKNQRTISELLKAGGNDFGVAFDGDADRIAFFDENGKFINSAIIGALISDHLLKLKPGAKIIYTSLTSRVHEETIRKSGGVPVLARVGHAFIKETMRQKDVLFACEHSGHFYFKDYFYTDSTVFTLRYVLEAYRQARKNNQTFSQMIAPYQIYTQTEDVIVAVNDKKTALEKVRVYLENKQPIKLKKFDGYLVDFGDVWGAVKISVTEPAIKLMFEGKKLGEAQALQNELVAYIKTIAND